MGEERIMEVRWATVLAIGIILAAFLHGGIYQVVIAGAGSGGGGEGISGDYGFNAYRLNRFTGDMVFCQTSFCRPVTWRDRRE